MVWRVLLIASIRLSTRRDTKNPPPRPRMTHDRQRPTARRDYDVIEALAFSRSRPTSSRKPPGSSRRCAPAHAPGPRPRLLDLAIDGLVPAPALKHARGERARHCSCEPFTARGGDKIETGAGDATRVDRSRKTRRLIPPCRYWSDRPRISSSTVSVICSVMRRRVFQAK